MKVFTQRSIIRTIIVALLGQVLGGGVVIGIFIVCPSIEENKRGTYILLGIIVGSLVSVFTEAIIEHHIKEKRKRKEKTNHYENSSTNDTTSDVSTE